MAKVKLLLSVEQEVKEYLVSEAERIGVPVSGFVSFMVDRYRKEQEIPDILARAQDLMTQVDFLERSKKDDYER